MSWDNPGWKEAAREYHAERRPTRLSKAEFARWRCESGLDDDMNSGRFIDPPKEQNGGQ
jgi:hypothetical protein